MKPHFVTHFVTLEPKTVAGLSTLFFPVFSPKSNGPSVIPQLWQRFNSRLGEIKGAIGHTTFGVSEIVSGEQMRYLACTEVTNGSVIPEGMEQSIIPGGRYAVFTHHGSLAELGDSYRFIYQVWAAESGEKLTHSADFELYDERFKGDTADSEFDIYVPVAERFGNGGEHVQR